MMNLSTMKPLEEILNPRASRMATPWGESQTIDKLGDDGVLAVTTASHGGIYVPRALLHRIPQAGQLWAAGWSGSVNWYEEDCAWSIVARYFPELFSEKDRGYAEETLQRLELRLPA